MVFDIELNIKKCTVELVHALEEFGAKNDYKVLHHGWDRLVFIFDSTVEFIHAADKLDAVCKSYGVEYTDLLDLDD